MSVLKLLRQIFNKRRIALNQDWAWPKEGDREYTNHEISNLLESNLPCLVGRVGSGERNIVNTYIVKKQKKIFFLKLIEYIFLEKPLPWRRSKSVFLLCHNAGFFPNTSGYIDRFCELYLNEIPTIDIFGRMSIDEDFLPINNKAKQVQLETLYPFFVSNPWTKALKNKNVLVIHPFSDTIEKQYKNRELLFENQEILPIFNLITLKPVQSIAGNRVPFNSWFEALEFMKKQIDEIDFDIAIIGCGAYGLPLASYIKRLGKKSILLSGGLQLLFGIKGKRWEVDYNNNCYRNMFNDYWVYPSEEEKPLNADKIEGGCYW